MAAQLPARMTLDEWVGTWMHAVTPVIRGSRRTSNFLMVYQSFSGEVMYGGKRYRVTGWWTPNGKPYVEAALLED